MMICAFGMSASLLTCGAEVCSSGAASSAVSSFTGEKSQRAGVGFCTSVAVGLLLLLKLVW